MSYNILYLESKLGKTIRIYTSYFQLIPLQSKMFSTDTPCTAENYKLGALILCQVMAYNCKFHIYMVILLLPYDVLAYAFEVT